MSRYGGHWMALGALFILAIGFRPGFAQADCRDTDCQNGGTCRVLPDNNADCYCLPSYYGTFCEYLNPCLQNNYCADRGNCSKVQAAQWKCACNPGFWGYKCSNLDMCASNPCPADRKCQNIAPSSFKCNCLDGTHECENPCPSSPCLNGGKCIWDSGPGAGVTDPGARVTNPGVGVTEPSSDFTCDCNPNGTMTGYFGPICEHYDPCFNSPCDERGGVCRNISDMAYVCDCHAGFFGNSCSSYDICLTSPCMNNGTCVSSEEGRNFTCTCPPIYKGSSCERIVQCQGDATVDIKGIIEWPDTDVFANCSIPCPSGDGGPNVTRECRYDHEAMAPKWTFPNTSHCEKANLTNDVAATMTSYLRDSTGSNPSDMGDSEVSSASELLDAVVQYSYEQQEMAHNMMECVSNLLEVKPTVLEASSQHSGADRRLLNLFTNYASNVILQAEEPDVTFDTPNLQYRVQELPPTRFSRDAPPIQYAASFHNQSEKAVAIHLPNSLVTNKMLAHSQNLRMRFTALKNSKLFITHDSDQKESIDAENQLIISAEVTGYRVKDLSAPIVYHLPTPRNDSNYTCVYWNETEKRWSTEGLGVISSDSNSTYCSSNHLTYFAVILDTGYSRPVPKEHFLPLMIITYAGTACSVFGLIATIVTYTLFKILRRTSSGKILIHLSVSLLALNVAFIVNTVPAVTRSRLGCKMSAMLLHYFVLSTFLWMGMEAVNMYRTLVQVFQKKGSSHFILKGAILAWGLPILPVMITGILSIEAYTKLPYNDICMLSRSYPYYYYGGYLGPCCALLVFNAVIFFMIMHTVCATKKDLNASSTRIRRTQIGCALSVTFLLGITWVLGFFAVEDTTLVFTYLVCIVNPLQGFFIFLFRCALYPEALRSWQVCCVQHTTNIERQQRSSSQGQRIAGVAVPSEERRRQQRQQTMSENISSRESRSSRSSRSGSKKSITGPKGGPYSTTTAVQFCGGRKHEGCPANNGNARNVGGNLSKRKVSDVNIKMIDDEDSRTS